MEYEILFLCNTLGIAITAAIVLYHFIGSFYHYSAEFIIIKYIGVKDERKEID